MTVSIRSESLLPDLASRPDLADRSIIVTLPTISNANRKFESEFWRSFKRAAPFILAALLDAVSTALARVGEVEVTETPRMADFSKWVTAAEPALDWAHGAFMESYASNRRSVEDAAIEGNPIALAIINLVSESGPWSGTATELLSILKSRYPMLTDDPHSFPRHPNKVSSELNRVKPLLQSRSVSLRFERRGQHGTRLICLK